MAAELGLKLELEKLKVPLLAQAALQVDHKEQTEDTAAVASASSSDICLILCGIKNPRIQKTT